MCIFCQALVKRGNVQLSFGRFDAARSDYDQAVSFSGKYCRAFCDKYRYCIIDILGIIKIRIQMLTKSHWVHRNMILRHVIYMWPNCFFFYCGLCVRVFSLFSYLYNIACTWLEQHGSAGETACTKRHVRGGVERPQRAPVERLGGVRLAAQPRGRKFAVGLVATWDALRVQRAPRRSRGVAPRPPADAATDARFGRRRGLEARLLHIPAPRTERLRLWRHRTGASVRLLPPLNCCLSTIIWFSI